MRAKAVAVKLAAEEDLAAAKGKLKGRIVLLADAREVKGEDKPRADPLLREGAFGPGAVRDPGAPASIDEEREDELKRLRFERR